MSHFRIISGNRIAYSLRAALASIALLAAISCAKSEPVPPPSLSPARSDQGSLRLTLDVERGVDDGPSDKAEAIYGMTNERQCSPKDYSSAIGGRWNNVTHRVQVDVVQENRHRYVARVPFHPMEDEDYYGLGVCRWALSVVVFDFGSPNFVGVNVKHIEVGRAELLCLRDGRGQITQCVERSSVPITKQTSYVSVTVNIDKE